MGALTEPGRGASARIQPAGGRGRGKRIEERLPLAPNEKLAAIARRCYWRGEPEDILRNGPEFILAVLDAGYWEHERWCAEHVDATIWREALARARPGRTSKKSWSWWAKRFGMPNVEERLADWPDHAHRLDVPVHKWMSRERMYAGHAHAHERRKATRTGPVRG